MRKVEKSIRDMSVIFIQEIKLRGVVARDKKTKIIPLTC